MNSCISISYASNDNYVLPLCCSIKSLIANLINSDTIVKVNILCSDTLGARSRQFIQMLADKKCKINFIDIDKNIFEQFHLEKNSHISRETYYRYLLADLLKDIDTILYLDCDTIILNDISEITTINMEDFYIAGVRDYSEQAFKKRLSLNQYCNAGVMLFNLKKIREENLVKQMIEYTTNHADSIPFQDQDVINIIFQKGTKVLDGKWNVQLAYYDKYNDITDNYLKFTGKILHYICEQKPWHYEYKSLYKKYFFKYFCMLPNEIQFLLLDFPPK